MSMMIHRAKARREANASLATSSVKEIKVEEQITLEDKAVKKTTRRKSNK